ncbi:hypothetical protein [Streptomyces daliensis]
MNLRDLRHVGAGLVKAAGGDIDDAKVKLRHSSIKLTSDTYMVMFQEMDEALAEGVVSVVPRARKAPEAEKIPDDAEPEDAEEEPEEDSEE